jgi:nucleoside-diphosphate-sugar epimerase
MTRVVAVTGATGFIGRHVCADLIARGRTVRAIVRPESPRPVPPGVEGLRTPLSAAALRAAFAGADAVVHLAGVVSTAHDADFAKVNVEGTRAVADAARDARIPLVHMSSLAASGPATADAPRREDDPASPITAYGVSKLEGERAVAATPGLRWTILRPGVVYGPGDRAVLPLFRLARRGLLPLVGGRDAAYTFVYIDDLVRAVGAALDHGADGLVCFVGHPAPVTTRGLLDAIRTAVGRAVLIVPVPDALLYPAALAGDLAGRLLGRTLLLDRRRYAEMHAGGFVCRVDRLAERLGIVATVDLGEGMARTAVWYREQRWLKA